MTTLSSSGLIALQTELRNDEQAIQHKQQEIQAAETKKAKAIADATANEDKLIGKLKIELAAAQTKLDQKHIEIQKFEKDLEEARKKTALEASKMKKAA